MFSPQELNDGSVIRWIKHHLQGAYAKASDLARVAFSGSYNDLSDKPNIPAGVTIDSALSSASENAVQNKAIYLALLAKADLSVLNDYLPLAGGTIAGNLALDGWLNGTSSSDSLFISGGDIANGLNQGAILRLYGKDYPGQSTSGRPYGGMFALVARSQSDGTGDISLAGDINGGLTWNNKSLEAVYSSNFVNQQAGYIRYTNGLQIVWGVQANLSAATTITYTVPFSKIPIVTVSTNNSNIAWVTGSSATGFTINKTTYSGQMRWIAIGPWS